MGYFEAALNNDTIAINEYLRYGDINIVDEDGMSLLHYAARGGAMEVGNILLNNNINPNIVDAKGETPLFEAVRTGQIGFSKLLLRFNADVNGINNNGESLLFRAIMKGKDELITLLLENGDFDYEMKNSNGENILFYCLKARKQQLFIKIANEHPELLDVPDSHNTSILMAAIKYNLVDAVNYLLGRDIALYKLNNEKFNTIMFAAKYGNFEIVKMILAMRPIINGKNMFDETCLSLAKNNPWNVYYLFDNYSISYDYMQYKKNYPAHIAVIERNYDLLSALNVDKEKRDVYGTSLKKLALEVNDPNILDILKIK